MNPGQVRPAQVDGSFSRIVMSTASLHIFFSSLLSPSCLFYTFSMAKKPLQGSSCCLWNESAYLPDTALTTECLSAPHVWCRVNTTTFTSSLARNPSFNQTAVLCLFAISALMVTTHTHTHTQVVRELRPLVFQWKRWVGLTLQWKEKTES